MLVTKLSKALATKQSKKLKRTMIINRRTKKKKKDRYVNERKFDCRDYKTKKGTLQKIELQRFIIRFLEVGSSNDKMKKKKTKEI